ncbi:hypothetical protein [Synechococcus sp. BL107]|uniref:hypothetical protein n=1 Tax=Synechococcus sp. BL107 TaxID=313625 RepID=UPI0002D32331|nr:hypothetical protein [Synechococcus sp. BL107]
MAADACNGCHQRGGNHLVVGSTPMAVVHRLAARACPNSCDVEAAKGDGSLWI